MIYPPPRHGYHTENAAEGARAQAKDVKVIALADLFPDRIASCRGELAKLEFGDLPFPEVPIPGKYRFF